MSKHNELAFVTDNSLYVTLGVFGKVLFMLGKWFFMLGKWFSANRGSQNAAKPIEQGLINILRGEEPTRKADIVFVHGLGGDLRETWHWQKSNQENWNKDNFWPIWLGNDLVKAELPCGIWLFGYDSKKFFLERGQTAPRYDQARLLLGYLQAHNLGQRPIFFITHSLGGLVVKEMLRVAQTHAIPLLEQTRGVVFLSTPHVGSDLAKLVHIISIVSLHLLKETVSVEELQAHNAGLRDLDEWYRINMPKLAIKTLPFYEMDSTWGFRVVDQDSANPKVSNQEFSTPVEADHISIPKCKTTKDLVYRTVKNFIQEVLAISPILPIVSEKSGESKGQKEQQINIPPYKIVKEGLEALITLMEISDVRSAVETKQGTFERARDFIDEFYKYKRLHDLFHELQISYPLIEQDKNSLTSKEKDWSKLNIIILPRRKSKVLSLNYKKETEWNHPLDILEDLLKIIKEPPLNRDPNLSINLVCYAYTELCMAVKNQDENQLENANWDINRALGEVPAKITSHLAHQASNQFLNELLEQLKKIREQLKSASCDGELVDKLRKGIMELDDINKELQNTAKDHYIWQQASSLLRQIGESNENPNFLNIIRHTWDIQTRDYRKLHDGIEEDWAQNLTTKAYHLDRALSDSGNNLEYVKKTFGEYRRAVEQRFDAIDKQLLKVCENLDQGVRKPLHGILKEI